MLKGVGYNVAIRPSEGSPEERENAVSVFTRNAQRALLCWGNASQSAVVNEIGDGALARWRAQDPENRSILLLLGPPCSTAKSEALETGLAPEIAKIVDATSGGDIMSMLALKLA